MTAWLTVEDLRGYVNNTKATGAELSLIHI